MDGAIFLSLNNINKQLSIQFKVIDSIKYYAIRQLTNAERAASALCAINGNYSIFSRRRFYCFNVLHGGVTKPEAECDYPHIKRFCGRDQRKAALEKRASRNFHVHMVLIRTPHMTSTFQALPR
jgi:hypothetical protein